MKNIIIAVALMLTATAVRAQTNEQVIKIIGEAVCIPSISKAHAFLADSGLKRLPNETVTSFGYTEELFVFIDNKNRIYKHDVPPSELITHYIKARLTFPSLASCKAAFAANGYKDLLYDDERETMREEPNRFFLRKIVMEYQFEGRTQKEYVAVDATTNTVWLEGRTQVIVDLMMYGPTFWPEEE